MKKVMKIKAIIHPAEEGGYWAEVPALPGCIIEGDRYQETSTSKLLPNLDIALLEECVMMPSRLEAIQRFTTR